MKTFLRNEHFYYCNGCAKIDRTPKGWDKYCVGVATQLRATQKVIIGDNLSERKETLLTCLDNGAIEIVEDDNDY